MIKEASEPGERVIYERETPYQYLRVVEDPRLAAPAGAQRGPGRALGLRAGDRAHRRRVGRVPGAAVQRARTGPPRRMAMLGNAAGTVSRAYGRYFPATRIDGVEIDPASDRGRAALLRPGREPAADRARRRRAAVPAPGGRRLRPDRRRRLPPALHPLLPGDGGVLRARARPAGARRRADRQRRPSRGRGRAGEDAGADDRRGVPARGPLPDRGGEHAAGRVGAPAPRGAGAGRRAAGRSARRWPRRPRPAWRRRCRAAASTPTTRRRSSGSSTPRS